MRSYKFVAMMGRCCFFILGCLEFAADKCTANCAVPDVS